MQTRGDKPGNVGDVRQQQSTDFLSDLREAGPVPYSRIRRRTGDQQLRLTLSSKPANLVEIDAARLAIDAVVRYAKPFSADVYMFAVRQVAAVIKVKR